MKSNSSYFRWTTLAVGMLAAGGLLLSQESEQRTSSYSPVIARMTAAKPDIARRQNALLEERYDLRDRPAAGVTMSRGKPVQEGVRAKVASGMSLERLAQMTPEEIREKDLWATDV